MDSFCNELENNEYYRSENESVSSENISISNNLTNARIGYNIDSMFEVLQKAQDEEFLDVIHSNLLTDVKSTADILNKIQQHNGQLKSTIDSSKYHVTELQEIQNEDREKCKKLLHEGEVKKAELDHMQSQQVNDLIQFENDINEISKDFTEGPKEYVSRSLLESIEQLQKDLSDKKSEIDRYKEEIIQSEKCFKQITTHESFIVPSLDTLFDEGTTDIDSLNKELKYTVEQLTSELNTMRGKFNLLTMLSHTS